MPVGDNESWLWCPVRPFSWETFFKDNLVEWCEWGITIPSRIEHFPSPSTSPFECTWDPNRRHWKKQTWEWKVLPSHLSSQSTSLLNSGAYWNHRARSVDQFTISSQVDAAHTIKIVFGWSQIFTMSHHWWKMAPKAYDRTFQAASNNNDADKDKRMPCRWYFGFISINGSQCEYL